MPAPSLALRLTALYVCTNLVLLGVLAWVQHRTLAADLAQEDDQLLLETLAAATRGLAIGDSTILPLSALGPWVREVSADCRVLSGPNLPLGPPPSCTSITGSAPMFRTWRSPAGRIWRIASVAPARRGGRTREVLLDRWTDEQTLRRYRGELLLALPLAFLLSAMMGYAVARGGLAPLRLLAERMGTIRLESSNHPAHMPRGPAELQTVTESFDVMLERLRTGHARLAQFASELAHELRTPVHVMRQQAEVALLADRSPEEYREALRSTLEELDDLQRLIEDTLFLAKAEDPGVGLERRSLVVRAELQDVAEYLEPVAGEKGVSLAIEVPGRLALEADRMLLRRALVNLVTNAIGHTPNGGKITLRGAETDEAIVIQVEDTGEGIPPADLPKVFDRHFRGASVKSGVPVGAGLGLSIVQEIIRLHGGTVEVASELARGTCVTLTIPRSVPSR
ncbi:MAG: heavy metal sensor histidine kinase [Gemmatimonadales bacterium]